MQYLIFDVRVISTDNVQKELNEAGIPQIDEIRLATREKFPIFHELFFFNFGNSPSLVLKRSHESSLQLLQQKL
jgi:hypothetical protein